jgi:two-component system chemotaxis sensor kinase CheA
MSDEREDLIAGYKEESEEHLVVLEEKLLALEKGEASKDDINAAFRAIHTVKGGSGFFGFQTIGSMAHVMEDLLGNYRSGSQDVSPEGCDALLEGYEKLLECFEDLDASEDVDIDGPHATIKKILSGGGGEDGGGQTNEGEASGPSKTSHPFGELPDTIIPGFYAKISLTDELTAKEVIENLNSVGEVIKTEPEDHNSAKASIEVLFSTVLDTDMIKDMMPQIESLSPFEELQSASAEALKSQEDSAQEATENTPETKEEELKGQEKAKDTSKAQAGTKEKNEPKAKKKAKQHVSIRVDFDVLSKLINLSGELILSRNQFINNLKGPLLDEFQAMSKQISELQAGLMKTRMQPLSVVTSGFPRLVRNLAKQLKKKVELTIIGEDIELDRNILEGISAPFTHILRNSLDHGIESPDERVDSGKAPEGRLIVNAFQRGGFVTIEVKDDGKGIDPEKIKSIAIKKGVISEADAAELNNKQAISLIYAPGFSTAEQVTAVSGRGVGMDVVKTDFEKLGGTVDLDSEFGHGTTLTVQLPLSVAIIQSLIVKASNELYAVPRNNIREVVILESEEEKQSLELLQGTNVLRHRNELLPIIRLSDILRAQRQYEDDEGEIKSDRRENIADRRDPSRREEGLNRRVGEKITILVMMHGEDQYGLVVEDISHQEETVVKNLNQTLETLQQFMGVTILSSGRVCFILDNQGMIKLADIQFKQRGFKKNDKEEENSETNEDYLIFEYGEGNSIALLAGLVKKTGAAKVEQIMKGKKRSYLTYGDTDYNLVFLDQALELDAMDIEKDFFFIIPKHSSVPFAFVASKVCGIHSIPNNLEVVGVPEKGKIGTVVFNENLLTVLDLYSIEENFFKDAMDRKAPKLGGNKKVLVVEDAFIFRKILKGYLDEYDIRSDMAQNGEEALEFLTQGTYDLVISDIEMPVMDGYELIKNIRDNPEFKSLPVIALTSLVSEESRNKGLEAGFNNYLIKTDKEEFLKGIQNALQSAPKPVLEEA